LDTLLAKADLVSATGGADEITDPLEAVSVLEPKFSAAFETAGVGAEALNHLNQTFVTKIDHVLAEYESLTI
jgi:hypothetical protein